MFSRFLVALVIGVASMSRVHAQSGVGLGYQFARLTLAGTATNFPVGASADYTVAVGRGWCLVGASDFSRRAETGLVDTFNAGLTISQLTLGGGIRRDVLGAGSLRPYLQGLVGLARTSARATIDGDAVVDERSIDFLIQPGAGLRWLPSNHFGLFVQGDYRYLVTGDDPTQLTAGGGRGLRVVAGMRYEF